MRSTGICCFGWLNNGELGLGYPKLDDGSAKLTGRQSASSSYTNPLSC
jgi:hypothetical protein